MLLASSQGWLFSHGGCNWPLSPPLAAPARGHMSWLWNWWCHALALCHLRPHREGLCRAARYPLRAPWGTAVLGTGCSATVWLPVETSRSRPFPPGHRNQADGVLPWAGAGSLLPHTRPPWDPHRPVLQQGARSTARASPAPPRLGTVQSGHRREGKGGPPPSPAPTLAVVQRPQEAGKG